MRRTKVFIGSSERDKDLCATVAQILGENQALEIRSWINVFGVDNNFILTTFEKQLQECDAFIFILSPDIAGHRWPAGQPAVATIEVKNVEYFGNQNVIFELGAAFGRYGIDHFVAVNAGALRGVSELDGLQHEHLRDRTSKDELRALCVSLNARIATIQHVTREKRIRWLTLMKCKPACQERVIRHILEFQNVAESKWDVEYENCGVIWGPTDDFLLFSVPGVAEFTGFIEGMRNWLKDVIEQADSRLVFPGKFFSQEEPPKADLTLLQLVLLSCHPDRVEHVFASLTDAARDESKRGIKDLDIISVGITTGEDDIFFIVASKSQDSYFKFVEEHLQTRILRDGWLVKNTTSLPITRLRDERSNAPHLPHDLPRH